MAYSHNGYAATKNHIIEESSLAWKMLRIYSLNEYIAIKYHAWYAFGG